MEKRIEWTRGDGKAAVVIISGMTKMDVKVVGIEDGKSYAVKANLDASQPAVKGKYGTTGIGDANWTRILQAKKEIEAALPGMTVALSADPNEAYAQAIAICREADKPAWQRAHENPNQ